MRIARLETQSTFRGFELDQCESCDSKVCRQPIPDRFKVVQVDGLPVESKPMSTVQETIDELDQVVGRLQILIDKTPDDRLFWKPAPTGRSIGEIGAHCAEALHNILGQLQGTPYAVPTYQEADASFRKNDAQVQSRTELLRRIEAGRAEYVAYLQTLDDADLAQMRTLPFGLGEAPLSFFITAGKMHTNSHVYQIEYIQTLYGDHDWYL